MAIEQPPLATPETHTEAEDGVSVLSKNALKKAAKEKEKIEKATQRKAAEDKQKQEAAASDVSVHDYGDLPIVGSTEYNGKHLAGPLNNFLTFEENATVVFRAVVGNARSQSAKLAFLDLQRRNENIQAVVAASETLSRQMVNFAKNLPVLSQVRVHGVVKRPKEYVTSTTMGHLEVHVAKLYVIARAEPSALQVEDCERALPAEGAEEATGEYQKLDEEGRPNVTLNTRLNNRTIDLRTKVNKSIFTIKAAVCTLFREFLDARGFEEKHTPKMQGASAEGGSSVFEVKYFDKKAYLAQSPQLYKQMLIAGPDERVYEVGSVFRAENSNTARHLTEFMGLDLEMEFEDDYHEVVDLLEELLLFIFNGLKTRWAQDTERVQKTYKVKEFKLPPVGKVPRLHFAEGVKMLREAGEEIGDFDDLSTPHEKLLGRLVLEKYNSDFYILDQYPLAIRPFYTMPSSAPHPNTPNIQSLTDDPLHRYSNSYDFHMRGQEILSGAQRIHNAALLEQRMHAMDPPVDPKSEAFVDYVDAFRHGCMPHGGAGMGLERIVMLWLGLPNIRLASLFPRDPARLRP